MDLAILANVILLVVVAAQRARFNALTASQARIIAELENDNAFWVGEAARSKTSR
jgi:hypothetical protein